MKILKPTLYRTYSEPNFLPSNKSLIQTIKKRDLASRFRPVALAISLALSASIPDISLAATYFVSNTNDAGLGSLRRAVLDANSVTPDAADTIELNIPVGSIITLLSELSITDSVTIKGSIAGNPRSVILDGNGTSRHINAGGFPANSGQTITLENMTLRNGFFGGTVLGGGGSVFVTNADLILNDAVIAGNSTTGSSNDGGGLYVRNGNTTLTQCTISGNSTTGSTAEGGGVFVRDGNVTLILTTVSGNSTAGTNAEGGGLFVIGDATLTQSTVSNNSTTGSGAEGGGLYIKSGNAMLTLSTISGNSTAGNNADGGGLFVRFGNATLSQSTLSENSTTGTLAKGGGLYAKSASVTLNQSTIMNNSAVAGAGGVSIEMSSSYNNATLTNSILSGNTGTEGNFKDTATTPVGMLKAINSLFGDPVAEITDPSSSNYYYSNAPDLGILQHNGGFTETHKPNASSPAINIGSNAEAAALNLDQRGSGFPRIIDATVDMGAVELQNVSNNSIDLLNPNEVLTRRDMAREFLKKISVTPPEATGIPFTDVQIGDINADWIEKFSADSYTAGCDANNYCPHAVVSRESMAKIFLKVKHGFAFEASSLSNQFTDVSSGSFNAVWINELGDDATFTLGCDTGKFCPKEPVTRKWFDTLLALLP